MTRAVTSMTVKTLEVIKVSGTSMAKVKRGVDSDGTKLSIEDKLQIVKADKKRLENVKTMWVSFDLRLCN